MNPPPLEVVQRAVGDRYEVLSLAGAGGMGAVYRARHRQLGNIVAVKVLPPEVATSRMRHERFRREASVAAQMQHPHLVPVYEFDLREGLAFLIMPFVRGVTLEQVLADRRLDPAAALRVLREVGAALDFLHRQGVVHRDIKPSNIMVEEDTGRTLLTDFGIARTEPSEPSTGGGLLTAPGTPLGTPAYMAPEQAAGEASVDGRADLYALALVAFESLTGTLPSLRADRAALARTLRASHPDVGSLLAAALVAPLADLPANRPPTAAAWLALIERGQRERRTRLVQALVAFAGLVAVVLAAVVALWPSRPTSAAVAVMPFAVLGESPYPPTQLPEYFLSRFSPVPEMRDAVSFGRVLAETGPQPVSASDGAAVAQNLGAAYFVQASVAFARDSVTLTATLYEVGKRSPRTTATAAGPAGGMSTVMDAVWAKILGGGFAPNPYETLPTGKDAIAAYINADLDFRRGAYDAARAGYDRVVAADPSFAVARFRRALVVAQTDPTGELVRTALRGAIQHQTGLSPADSLMLEGYALLLERGDGRAALVRFRAATDAAPGQPLPWFVLGEFYIHFGMLFDEPLDEAWTAFSRTRDLVPQFAPAIAHLVGLAYQRGDPRYTEQLMDEYRRLDSTSVVAAVIGVADTLLFGAAPARAHLVNQTLDRRGFEVLGFLAFQAAVAGTDADRQGPGRRVLQALARRAATEPERARALRMGVAADLRYGWVDSARARLRRADSPAAVRERDTWVLLARATGLPPLGDAAAATAALAARTRVDGDSDAVALWLLAVGGVEGAGDRSRAADRLRRLAADSAPLPVSLALDVEARRHLAARDTAGALARWDAATRRYEVLGVPFGLVASLWPQRLELARVAAAAHDTSRAARACATLAVPIGFVDQAVLGEAQHLCAPWRGVSSAR
ncbi:MAG TPA: protein kinase [Gemmatimonadales bacterium]|jgi:serine/threonine-protein kinase|nr:protein kinase [Gemmatimonadales bacterium]